MIRDIVGVYCPMGCGKTLHLTVGGMIACLASGCPNPGAAQKILSEPEITDIVVFGADSFTVLHPVKERLGDLWTCQVHQACTQLPGAPAGPGRYRARIDGKGRLELELIEETGRRAQPG